MAMALKTGLISKGVAAESAATISAPSFTGKIVAATLNPHSRGLYPRKEYETTLASFDLETGKSDLIPMKITGAHDVVKVKDNYLVLPNYNNSPMRFTDLSGAGKYLNLGENIRVTGHAHFDAEQNVVIVCTKDNNKDEKASFGIIDPDDNRILDFIER